MGYLTKNLGIRIKELRERNNLTQQKLAELIDMEFSNLSKIERGIQMPKEKTIERIIKVLKTNEEELFDFKHIMPKKELIEHIIVILNNSSIKELKTYYKILNSIKELNN